MIDILFENVSKSYKPKLFKPPVVAVDNLNLSINTGQVYGLIGPNGAGKSTTIRLLLGLSRPNSGIIRFKGKTLLGADILNEIGYLPENPYLYDHLTLEELLAFCGKASGLPSKMSKTRASELMSRLSLIDARKQPLRTFSKGMLQRAGICFALLHDPSVLILDEPMSGLDPLGRKMIFDIILDLKNQGKTIFFCSHILNDVERLCDKIGLMVKGKLIHVFDRVDFLCKNQKMVKLTVSHLSETNKGDLLLLVDSIEESPSLNTIYVSIKNLEKVSGIISSSGIEILNVADSRASLEEMFIEMVEGES